MKAMCKKCTFQILIGGPSTVAKFATVQKEIGLKTDSVIAKYAITQNNCSFA